MLFNLDLSDIEGRVPAINYVEFICLDLHAILPFEYIVFLKDVINSQIILKIN